jgi:hypothetical protein
MKTGALHNHIIVVTIGCLGHYATRNIQTDSYLSKLHGEISERDLEKCKFSIWDYFEVVENGMSEALLVVEVVDAAGHDLRVVQRPNCCFGASRGISL